MEQRMAKVRRPLGRPSLARTSLSDVMTRGASPLRAERPVTTLDTR